MAELIRLATGDQGEWVDYLKQVLTAQGYDSAPGNEFDDDLAAVVRRYQSDQGLTEDGVVDTQTWAALVPGEAGEAGEASIEIDWEQLPWLSMLAQYPVDESGVRQFLIDNNVSESLLAQD
jgi:murein L,D-transpeptidase YcbB/YkuD